jgi:L-fuculose-phosphate aldolase
METIEHFAKISLVARLLGGERLLSRQEVDRLQGLRGMYGIASPAPLCGPGDGPGEFSGTRALGDSVSCQTVFAPATDGARLVPDASGASGKDGEIRLTYRELTALIEAAVRELK